MPTACRTTASRIENQHSSPLSLDLPVARRNTPDTVDVLAIRHVVSGTGNLSTDWKLGAVSAAAPMVGIGPSVTLHPILWLVDVHEWNRGWLSVGLI